jgi:prophage regulatory protein
MTDLSFVSMRQAQEITTLSRSSLWRLIRRRRFPEPRRLSQNRVAFVRAEVLDWLASRAVAAVGTGEAREGQ